MPACFLQGLSRLETLDLFGAKITDNGARQLANLTSLQSLEVKPLNPFVCLFGCISFCIPGAGRRELSRETHVRSVGGRMEPAAGRAKAGVSPFPCSSGWTAGPPSPLVPLVQVCSGCITNLGVQHLSRIPNLRSLSLAQNPRITDACLGHLATMRNLEVRRRQSHPTLAGSLRVPPVATRIPASRLPGSASPVGALVNAWCDRPAQALNLSQSEVTGLGIQRLAEMPRLATLALYGAARVKSSAVNKMKEKSARLIVLGVL